MRWCIVNIVFSIKYTSKMADMEIQEVKTPSIGRYCATGYNSTEISLDRIWMTGI
jgi:hypothetical protein